MKRILIGLGSICLLLTTSLRAQDSSVSLLPSQPRAAERLRNPSRLTAVLELARIGDSHASKIRFEWPAVPRAVAYLLVGSVADRMTWTVRSTEHRITRETALEWTAARVQYETTLPSGLYSWKLVALYAASDQYDLSTPAVASFEIP